MNVTIADGSKAGFRQLENLLKESYHDVSIFWPADLKDMIRYFSKLKTDIIFLDSMYGNVYPEQVIMEARMKNPDVVVIAYVGEGDLRTAYSMVKAGADDVIFKPIHRSTARTVLDRYYKLDK